MGARYWGTNRLTYLPHIVLSRLPRLRAERRDLSPACELQILSYKTVRVPRRRACILRAVDISRVVALNHGRLLLKNRRQEGAERRLVDACVHKWKFHGAFVLNRRVDIHAIDVKPAR